MDTRVQIEDITDGVIKEYSVAHESGLYRVAYPERGLVVESYDEGVLTPVDDVEFIQFLDGKVREYQEGQ